MQPMYYLYFLLIPVVLYMVIRGYRSRSKWMKENTQFQVGEVAKRLKLNLIKGDPGFNLVMTGRQDQGAPQEVHVLLQGTPYDHPFQFSYYDKRWTEYGVLEKKWYQQFDASFWVTTATDVLPFELMFRNPNQMGAPMKKSNLPEQSFGQADLDENFVLYTHHKELAKQFVPLLGPLQSGGYVHFWGQGREIRFVMTEFGMMTAMYQLDALIHVLESMACLAEGKPALGAYSGISMGSQKEVASQNMISSDRKSVV